LYIYHHGKMAAFYSKDDSRIEAAIGRKFFSKSINAAKVGKLQVRSFNKVRNYQKKIKHEEIIKLFDKNLKQMIFKTLNLYREALSVHYLTQPQFFEGFNARDSERYSQILKKLAGNRFTYTRIAWTSAFQLAKFLLREYSKRMKIGLEQAESLLYRELAQNKITKKQLIKRAKAFVSISKNHRFKLYTGKTVQKYIDKYENYRNISSVKGIIGNKRGRVRGKAFVVSNENLDLNKLPRGMKKGMILIVQNAWPEFAKYYKLASAIITNEGGITSHGVVVSREFGIPCIVGTKIATKVFKDGDLVEVDANRGIVKKIN
ncbi:MAG: hypothetical protein HY398_01585, partial [Candidatus Doudnabacteria bacterium]|nr:hypothetical protein [Candidatus Doudnabacteria bacterium]